MLGGATRTRAEKKAQHGSSPRAPGPSTPPQLSRIQFGRAPKGQILVDFPCCPTIPAPPNPPSSSASATRNRCLVSLQPLFSPSVLFPSLPLPRPPSLLRPDHTYHPPLPIIPPFASWLPMRRASQSFCRPQQTRSSSEKASQYLHCTCPGVTVTVTPPPPP